MTSQRQADRWNRTLRNFRFNFAHGGHANDMDTLCARSRFERGEANLLTLFARLQLPVVRISDSPGDAIAAYPVYAAPGFVRLLEANAYVFVAAERLDLYLSGADGDVWSVSEADFKNALRLETLLPQLGVPLDPRPTIDQTERLFWALRHAGLPDWVMHQAICANLAERGQPNPEAYRQVRHALAPDFMDDAVWLEAHRELNALAAHAARDEVSRSHLAYRFPGFSKEVLERIAADARYAMR